jgi:hypothetical protein
LEVRRVRAPEQKRHELELVLPGGGARADVEMNSTTAVGLIGGAARRAKRQPPHVRHRHAILDVVRIDHIGSARALAVAMETRTPHVLI